MGEQGDITSLDYDLYELRKSKFDIRLAEQAKSWIFEIIKEPVPEKDLITAIKSGVVLCKLANKLSSSPIKYKESSLPFVQMENISKFLAFVSAYGVPSDEAFLTIDLYEEQDPTIVLQTIISLSRYVHKNKPEIPTIGPKLSTKHTPPIPKKPIHLKDWGLEYGYIKGADQKKEGVVFGSKRDIV